MEQEIWKDVVGYEGLYKVSNLGNVKSNKTNLKHNIDKQGYCFVNLSKNGIVSCFRIHQLVAKAFICNAKPHYEINHINGIKTDNRVCNLEWCSHKYNMDHARKNNLIANTFNSVNAMNKKTKKAIVQLKDNHIICVFDSLHSAERKTGIKCSHICNVLKGARKSAGGYFWKYK